MQYGDWKPGSKIPGDEELCNIFDVSRTVVRQALRELEFEGWIYRKRGRGTFIAEPKVSGVGLAKSLDAFYRSLVNRGFATKMDILGQAIVPAEDDVAKKLEILQMTPVVQIIQLFSVRGVPLFTSTSHIPYDMCRDLVFADLERGTIYEFIEQKCGLSIGKANRKITAVSADQDQANVLQIKTGDPLIYLESIGYSSDGEPLEYLSGYFLGEQMHFEVEILEVLGDGPD
jgi:GntR family transcriptional regulator